MNPNEAITVVIPTSPLFCNPSTQIIDETYAQFRKHLPEAKVLILADGVHPEEEYLRERYEGYLDALDRKAWSNVTVRVFNAWRHQSGMLRPILLEEDAIKTPLVLWSEHDIPLNNLPIDWQGIVDTLFDGQIGGIRFELTGDPPKRNEMHGRVTPHGIPLELSTQYVNWPQIFRLDYLKAFLEPFANSKTYLECAEFDGRVAQLWNRWQYGIYSPEGEIRRCYHTHGRVVGTFEISKPYIEVNGVKRYVCGGGYFHG
jgi:hypothetical protein